MPTDFIEVPDWESWENQGGGVAVADLTGDGRPDLVVFQVDSREGANRGLYRVGPSVDADDGVSGDWGGWLEVPDWGSWENQGADVAVAAALHQLFHDHRRQ